METSVHHDFIPDLFKVSPMCKVGGAPTPEIIDEIQSAKLNEQIQGAWNRAPRIYFKEKEILEFEQGNKPLPDGTRVKTPQDHAREIMQKTIELRQRLNLEAEMKAAIDRKMKDEAERYFAQMPKRQHREGMDPSSGVCSNLIMDPAEPLTIEKLVATRKKLSDELFTQAGYAKRVEEQQCRIASEILKISNV